MSKQRVHFEAIGYEPMRMKPVHFANGFFLSLIDKYHRLEYLNKAAIIKNKEGLKGDYNNEVLYLLLKEAGKIGHGITEANLKELRAQINGIVDNDDAVFAAFKPYSTFGNDYTVISDRFLTSQKRLDGFSGHFARSVLETTKEGKKVINFAKDCMQFHEGPIEKLLYPLLDVDEPIEWENKYPEHFGELSEKRLDAVSRLMAQQTQALAVLCDNLSNNSSQQNQLRFIILGLCAWLFIYIQKISSNRSICMLFDFLGSRNARLRALSRNSFTRQREMFFGLYQAKWDKKELKCEEQSFNELKNAKFKFLEQHFSDLAVRIGFAQPRTAQAKRKHFELQPDTARVLLMSCIKPEEIVPLPTLATNLLTTWGICFGGCDEDQKFLQSNGFAGLDIDADLDKNSNAFIELLKILNLANEPSDGLVLCASNPETLL